MKEHVGLFAVDRDVACSTGFNGVRRSGDVLSSAVFFTRLGGICFDSSVLSKVGIGNKQLFTESVLQFRVPFALFKN